MDELMIRRIIREARATTRNPGISTAEVAFIFQTTVLSLGEKLLWLYIATKTANHRAFCCNLTEKEMLPLVDDRPDPIFSAVENLKKHGFLNVYEQRDLGTVYALSLPEEGINALLDAPKLCACQLDSDATKSSFKSMMNLYRLDGENKG